MAMDMSPKSRQSQKQDGCMEIVHFDPRERKHTLLSERTESYLQVGKTKKTDGIPHEKELYPESGHVAVKSGKKKLGCWLATGICGNNITSSCLYVIALCAVPAGKYAPIALSFIAGLLYLFRGIYTEVVEALPVNGGTYNLLLNTTSKSKASVAACLTMLSYVTTAVISSTSGMSYIQTLFTDPNDFPLILATILCLSFAAILNLAGISESAVVALIIFIFHMTSIALLIAAGFYTAFSDMPRYAVPGSSSNETIPMLIYNWKYTSPPDGIFLGTFFGYANALLGISGFESSSNYVEDQAPGVFPKTLRNMWIAVTVINPLTALLAQCLMPMPEIAGQAESGALLSQLANLSAGSWLQVIIVVDGAMVLIGAVIVAFVGFVGLVHRMTLDRCLPQVLLRTNQLRGTRHWIICGFWGLTSALVLFTQGNVETMAGIYTMAFLTVMILFTVGNMLIKLRRSTLPTPMRVSYPVVVLAFFMMSAGLVGNILSQSITSLQGFIMFGAVFFIPVQVMLNRVWLMRMLATAFRPCVVLDIQTNRRSGCCVRWFQPYFGECIKEKIHDPLMERTLALENKPLVFFTSNDEPPVLLEAIRYFQSNEIRIWYKFVRVYATKEELPTEIPQIYASLDKLFTSVQIDYVATYGDFGPDLVRKIQHQYKIPLNFMFMSSFSNNLNIRFMDLGGLRLITPNLATPEEEEARESVVHRKSARNSKRHSKNFGNDDGYSSEQGGILLDNRNTS